MPDPPPSVPPRWLVQFGYDGAGFDGWARQPGRRTIEGEIVRRLRPTPRRPEPVSPTNGIDVASRTDRGVSARGNALAVRSRLSGPALLRQLNGISPEIFFTAATPIPEGFRVRSATRRTYRYWESDPAGEATMWREAAALFHGPVDVRSFGRGIPVRTPQLRTVESVEVTPFSEGLRIEVRAPSFVWGMVRKIVAALREHGRGRLPLARLRAAVEGELRLTLPMAEPEPLVLWEVEYPIPWTIRWGGANRHQRAHVANVLRQTQVRQVVLETLVPGGPTTRSVE